MDTNLLIGGTGGDAIGRYPVVLHCGVGSKPVVFRAFDHVIF